MHRKLLALAGAVLLNASAAEPAKPSPSHAGQDPLLARCELLKRQADRNACIAEVVRAPIAPAATAAPAAPPPPTLPKPSEKEIAIAKASDVFAAADAIKSVVNAGISYNDYSQYIQRLAVALDAYRAKAKLQEETGAADLLAEALEACKDAREFWRADIEFYSRRDNYLAYPGGLPVDIVGMRSIVNKYSLPTQDANWLGLQQGTPRGAALAKMWEISSGRIHLARQALEEIDKPDQPYAMPTPATGLTTLTPNEISSSTLKLAREALLGAGCSAVGEPQVVREPTKQDMISFRCSGTDSWQTAGCDERTCHVVEGPRFVMKSF